MDNAERRVIGAEKVRRRIGASAGAVVALAVTLTACGGAQEQDKPEPVSSSVATPSPSAGEQLASDKSTWDAPTGDSPAALTPGKIITVCKGIVTQRRGGDLTTVIVNPIVGAAEGLNDPAKLQLFEFSDISFSKNGALMVPHTLHQGEIQWYPQEPSCNKYVFRGVARFFGTGGRNKEANALTLNAKLARKTVEGPLDSGAVNNCNLANHDLGQISVFAMDGVIANYRRGAKYYPDCQK